ncbi:LysR family transcriptional regulator [Actinomadura kijaniata]|uniref:DNA-binding transcriptional LysR family regulator n=1 Tax=Actinomadura namibiensis TaxID=182080 RepID=A0A7W3LMI8_ACTNM|nr:LysR family transcriptional regulator [Actinomadura namibiensis]MBA8950858.1 DNA-binding transcriptional LysR family regulator [Actinomadura namibiensis]
MEMREIEAFLEVARELHFGRAAARLGVSAPRVSQAVRALERRVGAPLFERTSRRVRLTPLGERLRAELQPAYRRMERALEEARSGARTEVLRVGVATSLPAAAVDGPIRAFERARPRCAVVRSAHPNTDPARWGNRWPVDVFVGWLPADPARVEAMGFHVGPAWFHRERAALVAAGHPLGRRAGVDVEELAGQDLLYPSGMPQRLADLWTPPATPGGTPLRRVPRHRSASLEEAVVLVAGGDVIHLTVTSVSPHDPRVVTVPVSGLPPMVCAPVWSADAGGAVIDDFARITARGG